MASSDEDNETVSKYSKVEESVANAKGSTKTVTRKKSKQVDQPTVLVEKVKENESTELPVLRRSSRISSNTSSSRSSQNREENKVDAIIEPSANDIEVPSMYEDAIEKSIPVVDSTLKDNNPVMPEKQLNATVVLERLPHQSKLNETVVIQKAGSARNSKRLSERESTKKKSQDNTQSYKASVQYNNCNGLITDDESSPEIKKPKRQLGKKLINKKQIKNLSTSSEDEIPNTPVERRFKDAIVLAVAQDNKTTYKSNALFSPYAKESVKKRVEAFEQAVMYSPKPADVDVPTRITRTKTRAMKERETEIKNPEKSVTQILARKSLVKAKKISLAKQKKNNDELKEVKESAVSYFTIIILIFSTFVYR